MADFRALCVELTDCLEKSDWPHKYKPVFEQWIYIARKALAEPKPEWPTDEELLELTEDWPCTTGERYDLSGCPEVPPFSLFEDELVEFARAVLAHWGNCQEILDSSSQPIPVSKRLPGPGDSDADGRCWWYGDGEDLVTHWLPAHALPRPS